VAANRNQVQDLALHRSHPYLHALHLSRNLVQNRTFRKDASRVFTATTFFTRQSLKRWKITLVPMNLSLAVVFIPSL
jgi:hypothetical protein